MGQMAVRIKRIFDFLKQAWQFVPVGGGLAVAGPKELERRDCTF
jgi:hypothetical protein